MLKWFAAVFALAVALGVGACKYQGAISCLPPPLTGAFAPVYPIPSATGVPDAPQDIVLYQTISNSGLSNVSVVLAPPSGPSIIGSNFRPAPSPFPTPYQTPSPVPGGKFVAVTVPTLAAATTYQVSAKFTVSNTYCGPQDYTVSVGSFTTQ
jgi:hypothetical protein